MSIGLSSHANALWFAIRGIQADDIDFVTRKQIIAASGDSAGGHNGNSERPERFRHRL